MGKEVFDHCTNCSVDYWFIQIFLLFLGQFRSFTFPPTQSSTEAGGTLQDGSLVGQQVAARLEGALVFTRWTSRQCLTWA